MPARSVRRTAGVTLVELIIAIVVVGIALAAIMSVFVVTTHHSADPMLRVQAQILAEGYLDEVLLKKFYDTTSNRCARAGRHHMPIMFAATTGFRKRRSRGTRRASA